ncbi:MAG: hypothetical protein IJ213_00770 [Bacteroidales bacterium]|nr:hypothetical protein [Bacteroidales bacterium]
MKIFRKLTIILTLAGLTLFIACNNDDDEPEEKHNKVMVLTFNSYTWGITLHTNHLDSVYSLCDTLYLEPETGWDYYNKEAINDLTTVLYRKHGNRPNMKGRGSFDFTPGTASEEDSLKLIGLGYSINAKNNISNLSP